jgi:3-dehydroquinate synthase
VDLPEGKNLVGAFKQPKHVLIDVDTLKTLPRRELLSGLAEVVKYGVILDEAFLTYMEAHVDDVLALDSEACAYAITRSCELKATVVLEDEHDLTGLRAVLNYGHTFGHALETLGGYNALTHGEGVAIGMMMAADLVAGRNSELVSLVERMEKLWSAFGLMTRATAFDPQAVLAAMRSDKKYENGRTRLILPFKAGDCRLVKDVPEEEILAAIRGRCDA